MFLSEVNLSRVGELVQFYIELLFLKPLLFNYVNNLNVLLDYSHSIGFLIGFIFRLLKPSFSVEPNLIYTIKDEVLEFWVLG